MNEAIDIYKVAKERDLNLEHPNFSSLKPKSLLRAVTSTNSLLTYSPDAIPSHRKVVRLVRKDFDYKAKGVLSILLSGSVGSAKSILLAHLAVSHAMKFPRARVAIARRSLPDIKETIFAEILEHLEADAREGRAGPIEGIDYFVNRTRATITFPNGSVIQPVYWADKNYKRARSKPFSMVIIEEATENSEQDFEGVNELYMRLDRMPHVKEQVFICATNPDSPAHWLYDYFIDAAVKLKYPNRFVFYSRTEDNPYLKSSYVIGLRNTLTAKMARRMLDGEWIEINSFNVYYAYCSVGNFLPKISYKYDKNYPIRLSFDFNIGKGKPMSMCIGQYIGDVFHFGHEVVIHGSRTQDVLDEIAELGILDLACKKFIVHGDASGRHKDTRNRKDDYEIIMDFLSNYKKADGSHIEVERQVPLSNQTVRSRHNKVNSYMFNAAGVRRLFVYKDCPTLHKGFRLVDLKKGADYVEDDSKEYQHVTTAAGYLIQNTLLYLNNRKPEKGTR